MARDEPTVDQTEDFDDPEPFDYAAHQAYDAALERHEDMYYRNYDEELTRQDQELACAAAEAAAAASAAPDTADDETESPGESVAAADGDVEVDERG